MKLLSVSTRLAFALVLGTALSACNQTLAIQDGVIPNEFLPHVQKFLGNYRGQVERRSVELQASLEGNRFVLKSPSDLLSTACESKIGDLIELTYRQEEDKTITIQEAVFKFDPNLCGETIRGQKIYLSTAKQSPLTLDLELFSHYEWRWTCNSLVDPTGLPSVSRGYHPAPIPGDYCRREQIGVFLTGRFIHI